MLFLTLNLCFVGLLFVGDVEEADVNDMKEFTAGNCIE